MKICLFGSGSKNIDDKYLEVGYHLGKSIASNKHTLVFGGGNDGMMGSVARGARENNGMIIGIIPQWMNEFEELYEDCDEVIYTNNMDDRKLNFIQQSDLFIISPGGIGTLDELFEVLTLKKVKKHDKKIIILNVYHYYDKLLDMLSQMIKQGFVNQKDKDMLIITSTVDETMDYINKH